MNRLTANIFGASHVDALFEYLVPQTATISPTINSF